MSLTGRLYGMILVAVLLNCALVPAIGHSESVAVGNGIGYAGMPGLVEMPTALSLPDAEMAATLSGTDTQHAVTLTFQAMPKLTAAFRYGRFEGIAGSVLYDRSLDLQYKLFDEHGLWPTISVGFRDLVGTGINSSEYIVATRHVTPNFSLTAGLGWGRMGSYGGWPNPFGWDTRVLNVGKGGRPDAGAWFRGPVAPFGGLQWQASDKLNLSLEYSSDAHSREVRSGVLHFRTPINLGISYTVRPNLVMSTQWLHGSTIAIAFHVTFNPKVPMAGGDRSPAPPPFVQPSGDQLPGISDSRGLTRRVAADLETQGIRLVELALTEGTARAAVNSDRYNLAPQMIGRTARVLSVDLPPNIQHFEIEPIISGMAAARISLQRNDLPRLQYSPEQTAVGLAATGFDEGTVSLSTPRPGDAFEWGVSPYVSLSLFDPAAPLRGDLGLQFNASYALTSHLSVSGAFRIKAIGDEGSSSLVSNSALPHVRSDAPLYARDGADGIENLTLDYFGKVGPAVYSHLSLGYLEAMYAGASAEVLWQPVRSRFQIGAELDRVLQRDTDKLFGVHDYGYAVTTGKVSLFYQPSDSLEAQLDIGRYLAGDYGSTLTLTRTFSNGWRIGTFATLTNVPFNRFGEGSFDKGFIFVAPLAWVTGHPTTRQANFTLRPIQRDGGAQLNIRNRLHEVLRGYRQPEMAATWGAFWR